MKHKQTPKLTFKRGLDASLERARPHRAGARGDGWRVGQAHHPTVTSVSLGKLWSDVVVRKRFPAMWEFDTAWQTPSQPVQLSERSKTPKRRYPRGPFLLPSAAGPEVVTAGFRASQPESNGVMPQPSMWFVGAPV